MIPERKLLRKITENCYVRSQFKYKYPSLPKWLCYWKSNDHFIVGSRQCDKEVEGTRWPKSQLCNRRRNENRRSVTALTFTSQNKCLTCSHDLTLLLIHSTGKCSRNYLLAIWNNRLLCRAGGRAARVRVRDGYNCFDPFGCTDRVLEKIRAWALKINSSQLNKCSKKLICFVCRPATSEAWTGHARSQGKCFSSFFPILFNEWDQVLDRPMDASESESGRNSSACKCIWK